MVGTVVLEHDTEHRHQPAQLDRVQLLVVASVN